MPLLNYTTTVSASRTIAEVHRLLVRAGARQIMTTYSSEGSATGVAFAIETPDGPRSFTLPVEVARVLHVLERDRQTPSRYKTPEHAERVAWRIVKDWLQAQLAIVQTEMVTFDEVMLPYMRTADGRTVFEIYSSGELVQPALGPGGGES